MCIRDSNTSASDDMVQPPYNNQTVFECKYELDSLAAFLSLSHTYYNATHDISFFARHQWVRAVRAVLDVATAMQTPTYAADGHVLPSPYNFTRLTTSGTETLANKGSGNPVQNGTGLIRSAFRPSDDATIFQFLIPANMMFARNLAASADIMCLLPTHDAEHTAAQMRSLSAAIRTGIAKHGVVQSAVHGSVYAYEVDGYGSANMMDDANIPSLLSAPLLGYLNSSDPIYTNTRAMVLSHDNPYWAQGPVLCAVGGPHDGPGYAWPMASIVRVLTGDGAETGVYGELKQLVSSTDGLGLIHESINAWNHSDWSRQW